MTEATQTKPWASFGYEPVGAIVNRLLARYLRAQRKNMRRFFQERGMYVLADRMNQIRKSRQGMLAKNRMFQEVLNDYSKLSNPPPSSLFQGPYYNRRRSLPVKPRKPLISKLAGTRTWVCRVRVPGEVTAHGFGHTPTAAYNAWKRAVEAEPC